MFQSLLHAATDIGEIPPFVQTDEFVVEKFEWHSLTEWRAENWKWPELIAVL